MNAAGVSRLELLASAVAGVPLAVTAAEPGELPWTDGAGVFVDPGVDSGDQLRAVVVQAALLAAGSLSPDVLATLARHRSLVGRYLAVEGHRALAIHEEVVPPSVRGLIDRQMAARSPSPAGSLAIARGREEVCEVPAMFGTIRPRSVRATKAFGSEDAVPGHVPRQTRQRLLQELDDGEDTGGVGGFDLFNPVGGGGAVGRFLRRLLSNSRTGGKGNPGAEVATHRTKHGGRVTGGVILSSSGVQLDHHPDRLAAIGARYPEWNVVRRAYRPDWCTVVEVEAEVSGSALPTAPESLSLRRSLARLGLDVERRHRQLQGDDIDIDATVEARVALVAGTSPDEATYIDSVRKRRELSVLILLDVSGSAGEPSGAGGTVHQHQRTAATALTSALHDLGDRVALYGFRSQGRSAVNVIPVKRFEDRFDSLTLRRLNSLVPGAYTRLGAAIRHGSSVLERDGGTMRRLLVVVSDGFAYDHGYEGAYAEADARRALAETRRRGTACLCLSLGAGTDAESLRRVFGSAAYASFRSTEQLSIAAAPLFRSALRLAELQRLSSQRMVRTRERLHVERRSV